MIGWWVGRMRLLGGIPHRHRARCDACLGSTGRILLLNDTEQVAIWVFQHHEVRAFSISPWIPPRTNLNQALDLAISVVSVKI
jgi:hypothetical protein